MAVWKHRSTLTLVIGDVMGKQWTMKYGSVRLQQLRVRLVENPHDFELRVTTRDGSGSGEVFELFDSSNLGPQDQEEDYRLTFTDQEGIVAYADKLRIIATGMEVGDQLQIDLIADSVDGSAPAGLVVQTAAAVSEVVARDSVI